MSLSSFRRIFKTQTTNAQTLIELLESMFIAELINPGERVWLISPWISDVILIDNRTGNYDSLNPEWGRREVRLAEILVLLMSRGSEVRIVTREDPSNDAFKTRLAQLVVENNLDSMLEKQIREKGHTKGILLGRCLLTGSMNLTYNGLVINDEEITCIVDEAELQRTRLEFERYWKGF